MYALIFSKSVTQSKKKCIIYDQTDFRVANIYHEDEVQGIVIQMHYSHSTFCVFLFIGASLLRTFKNMDAVFQTV